jgi:hypothetical protein
MASPGRVTDKDATVASLGLQHIESRCLAHRIGAIPEIVPFLPLVVVDAIVAEQVDALVHIGLVEVAPGLAFSRASYATLTVHVGLLLESEVRRAIAAAASTMPIESVPDAVTFTIAGSASVVEARG